MKKSIGITTKPIPIVDWEGDKPLEEMIEVYGDSLPPKTIPVGSVVMKWADNEKLVYWMVGAYNGRLKEQSAVVWSIPMTKDELEMLSERLI